MPEVSTVSVDAYHIGGTILIAAGVIGISASAIAFSVLMTAADEKTRVRGVTLGLWVAFLLFLIVTGFGALSK